MMLGLYTDAAWHWSSAEADAALAECRGESPAWAGGDEDIEAFIEIVGLDALNTALVHHKHRHLIREGDVSPVPLRYVEFVLGCWWRALRFHQAVAVELDRHGLGGTIPVISGLIDMRPEVVAVHWPVARMVLEQADEADSANPDCAELPTLTRFNLIQRGRLLTEDEPQEPVGISLRRRVAVADAEAEAQFAEGAGMMRRLLGR